MTKNTPTETPAETPAHSYSVKHPVNKEATLAIGHGDLHAKSVTALLQAGFGRAVSSASSQALFKHRQAEAAKAVPEGGELTGDALKATREGWLKDNETALAESGKEHQTKAVEDLLASLKDGTYADSAREGTGDPLLPYIKIVLANALKKNWALVQAQDVNAPATPPAPGTKEHTGYTKLLEAHFGSEKVRAKAEELRSASEL